jgi:hypothetical protein
MSLLYKPKEEQTISVEIEVLKDKRVVIEFYSDCGKFGTDEALCGYVLTAERLLKILQNERNKYSDDEM